MMGSVVKASRHTERGASMVELGFGLTFLAIIVVGTVDFARIFYFSMQLEAAARAGAQYAGQSMTISGDTATATLNAIKDAAIAAYTSGGTDTSTRFALTRSDVTLGEAGTGNTTAEVPKCAKTDGSGFYPPDGGVKTCASACPPTGQSTATTKVCYVKVTVTKQFTSLSRGFSPFRNPFSVSRSAWWRVE